MKSNKINKLISKVLNETLEEKVSNLESKLKKDINELGGMEDEHPVFGKLNLSKMSRKEVEDLFKKHYNKDFEDSEEDEEEDIEYVLKKDDDEDEYEEDFEEEMEEGFDSSEIKRARHGKDYSEKEFEELPVGRGDAYFDEDLQDDQTGISFDRFVKRHRKRDEDNDDEGSELEFAEGKGETCEQCGSGMMKEGECSECGYMKESYDVDDIDDENEFDYVEEEMDMEDEEKSGSSFKDEEEQKRMCKSLPKEEAMVRNCSKYLDDEETGEMTEKLHGRQRKLDKNKNGRLDSADFKMLRAMKGKKHETDEEVEEGNAFTGALSKAKKEGEDEFTVGGKKFNVRESKGIKKCKVCGMKNCKCNHKKKSVKESIQLTESQLIDLIEKVILEQKLKYQSMGKPRGLQKYEQAHGKSGKENKDNLKAVAKKMKDYLKDGSKGDFEMNPKHFPKGNGELAKMSKKAYVPSDAIKDYTDNLTAAGLENLDYDEIHPNEDWVSKNIEGSSQTGNNPEWANAVETGVNKKRNKIRKDNMLAKIKRKAYHKAPQPIVQDNTGEDSTGKLMMKLESTESKSVNEISEKEQNGLIMEEFDKIMRLMNYSKKTQ